MIIQTAVEAEVEAFLGRARYQRAATAGNGDDAPAAHPNRAACQSTSDTWRSAEETDCAEHFTSTSTPPDQSG